MVAVSEVAKARINAHGELNTIEQLNAEIARLREERKAFPCTTLPDDYRAFSQRVIILGKKLTALGSSYNSLRSSKPKNPILLEAYCPNCASQLLLKHEVFCSNIGKCTFHTTILYMVKCMVVKKIFLATPDPSTRAEFETLFNARKPEEDKVPEQVPVDNGIPSEPEEQAPVEEQEPKKVYKEQTGKSPSIAGKLTKAFKDWMQVNYPTTNV